MSACNRSNCFAFNQHRKNNCSILTNCYKKSENCPFHKHKSDVNIKEMKKACMEYRKG